MPEEVKINVAGGVNRPLFLWQREPELSPVRLAEAGTVLTSVRKYNYPQVGFAGIPIILNEKYETNDLASNVKQALFEQPFVNGDLEVEVLKIDFDIRANHEKTDALENLLPEKYDQSSNRFKFFIFELDINNENRKEQLNEIAFFIRRLWQHKTGPRLILMTKNRSDAISLLKNSEMKRQDASGLELV